MSLVPCGSIRHCVPGVEERRDRRLLLAPFIVQVLATVVVEFASNVRVSVLVVVLVRL